MPNDLTAAKTCVFANWHSILIKVGDYRNFRARGEETTPGFEAALFEVFMCAAFLGWAEQIGCSQERVLVQFLVPKQQYEMFVPSVLESEGDRLWDISGKIDAANFRPKCCTRGYGFKKTHA